MRASFLLVGLRHQSVRGQHHQAKIQQGLEHDSAHHHTFVIPTAAASRADLSRSNDGGLRFGPIDSGQALTAPNACPRLPYISARRVRKHHAERELRRTSETLGSESDLPDRNRRAAPGKKWCILGVAREPVPNARAPCNRGQPRRRPGFIASRLAPALWGSETTARVFLPDGGCHRLAVGGDSSSRDGAEDQRKAGAA